MVFKHQAMKRRNSETGEEAITAQDIQIQSNSTGKMGNETKGVT